jgi:hypothetical protein
MALGFTAALMGQMIHMQVDIYSSRPQVQMLFVVAALIGAMSRMNAVHSARCGARPCDARRAQSRPHRTLEV